MLIFIYPEAEISYATGEQHTGAITRVGNTYWCIAKTSMLQPVPSRRAPPSVVVLSTLAILGPQLLHT